MDIDEIKTRVEDINYPENWYEDDYEAREYKTRVLIHEVLVAISNGIGDAKALASEILNII